MDHFEIRSLRRLESRSATVVTARRTSDLLCVRRYGRVQELGWNESATVGPLTIRAFQVNHWGARMQTDAHRGYNGYTIEGASHRVLFGGDTALTDSFQALKNRHPYNPAIMPVGAYNPWIHYHCTPEQAWRVAQDAGFEFLLPSSADGTAITAGYSACLASFHWPFNSENAHVDIPSRGHSYRLTRHNAIKTACGHVDKVTRGLKHVEGHPFFVKPR